ncbi:unnamed protein product [Clonostachys chloroleuca]|uniref:Uncharacterized protein n=1 Tax=Clonostachys chloroleuca TaxID=1926264 RepID=A0AA35M0L8_9HYPO|nr:unnamed protein product [Clonostachys chloroleuca]
MTQITQEKRELQLLKIVKKRSLSKHVEHKTAEMCDVIGRRSEQEVGHLRETLEQYEAKAMEYEDKIQEASSELADLDDLIKECENKSMEFSSKRAESQSLLKEREDAMKKLYDEVYDKLLLSRHLEENISGFRLDVFSTLDQIAEH